VTIAEIDAAIEILAERHLLTRLPDGQVFRASPAEYRLTLEGLPGFASQVDPMGGELACKSRTVSRRRRPRTSPGPSACPRERTCSPSAACGR
jgi:hypothetical protein